MPTTDQPTDMGPAAATSTRHQWTIRPAVFGIAWALAAVMMAVAEWCMGDRADPTPGLLAGRALAGGVYGLPLGFVGNWVAGRLARRAERRIAASPDSRPDASPANSC